MTEKALIKIYVAGSDPVTRKTIENVRQYCSKVFANGYEVLVVNIVENQEIALKECILAIPTIVKEAPKPSQNIIGHVMTIEDIENSLKVSTADG
ncbi:MAG: hypothetical protein MJE63_25155 [Proteobacteria bacterium]|nr:hypothetical protein [Pseudomonadota bacterium]